MEKKSTDVVDIVTKIWYSTTGGAVKQEGRTQQC